MSIYFSSLDGELDILLRIPGDISNEYSLEVRSAIGNLYNTLPNLFFEENMNLQRKLLTLIEDRQYLQELENRNSQIEWSIQYQKGTFTQKVLNLITYITMNLYANDPLGEIQFLNKNMISAVSINKDGELSHLISTHIHFGRILAIFSNLFGIEHLPSYCNLILSSIDGYDLDGSCFVPYLNININNLFYTLDEDIRPKNNTWLREILASGKDMSLEVLRSANDHVELYDDTDHTYEVLEQFNETLYHAVVTHKLYNKYMKKYVLPCEITCFAAQECNVKYDTLRDYIIDHIK